MHTHCREDLLLQASLAMPYFRQVGKNQMNKIYCAESTEGVQPPTDSAIAKAVPPWDVAVGSLPNAEGFVEIAAGVIVGSDHLSLCNGAEVDGKGSVI